ncbi:hypothetical protein M407DRAFT_245918 [Tulasnella calospora MUT 4182]|uniref:Uncharacterized protein n=1 Tax=Tulasnella calospora MUT 4182 TaxID=1051891 RepID=A0A0C3KFE9_9AGAM|nr:hypothetical protein M407DRAFT_245918 [Tulasnella calospora MUT 4182]
MEELGMMETQLPRQDLWTELNDLYVELECRTRARGGSIAIQFADMADVRRMTPISPNFALPPEAWAY